MLVSVLFFFDILHLDIFIKNLSETPIVFQPDSVHANLLTKKDDTLKLEVYTNEE